MSQTQILSQMPEHAGVCDRLGTVHIPRKKSHYALAPRVMALHEQLCRKPPRTSFAVDWVVPNFKSSGSKKKKKKMFWSIDGDIWV